MMPIKPKVFKESEKQRYGKGFSREEMKKAGLNLKAALKLNIPVDSRRKTAHEENIDALKAFLESKKAKAKPKKKSKS